MATLAEIYAAEYAAQRDEFPATFTFSSASYTGILTDTRRELPMMDAGFLPQAELELNILLADFATAPTLNDTLTIASVDYRVSARMDGADTVTAILSLKRIT